MMKRECQSKLVAEEKKTGARRKPREQGSPDDQEMTLPTFQSEAELGAWWNRLPKVEIEVDERLKKYETVSVCVNQRTIEGLDRLAKEKGIRRESLIYLIIDGYLKKHLPPDVSGVRSSLRPSWKQPLSAIFKRSIFKAPAERPAASARFCSAWR
jgi:hypothetical protein